MKKIKGWLVTLNGNCKNDLNGIYTIFIPSKSKKEAIEYVNGNGDILNAFKYEIDYDLLSDTEKETINDRIKYCKS